jgi:hypothetical protein
LPLSLFKYLAREGKNKHAMLFNKRSSNHSALLSHPTIVIIITVVITNPSFLLFVYFGNLSRCSNMLPNQRAQSPSRCPNARRPADPNPPKCQRSNKGQESSERGGEGCALPGTGGCGTRDDPHYVLPAVSGRGTRDDSHYISSPDRGVDQPRTNLQEEDRSKRQERGSAREFLSRSVGRAKGILAIRTFQ